MTSAITTVNDNSERPIGVFDSGLGGLTVVAKLMQALPQESLIYLGDTARLPYGNKSPQTVLRYTQQAIDFFRTHEIKLLLIACNTSSSLALPYLKNGFEFPIIGVIEPGVEEALQLTKNGRIGVIATKATIFSNSYQRMLLERKPSLKVYAVSCPLFVPLVEEGWLEDELTYKIAERYLKPLKEQNIDTLILGCTHYPLLKKVIQEIMGSEVVLIDSAEAVANKTKFLLQQERLLGIGSKIGKYHFYVTDDSYNFVQKASLFLGRKLEEVKEVILTEASYV